MLFNSLDFALFLPIVFTLYWFVLNKNRKSQNFLILIASYFFYACWDWRILFLLAFSTGLDYCTGIKVAESENKKVRKLWFWLSISVNLGFLGFFKHYNFFIISFSEAIANLGFQVNPWTIEVILPVGISFYTFHGLSYIIDIYYDKIKPEKNFIDYSLFVSFFPLLVAGPIERATHLLPQIKRTRTFDYSVAVDGMRQILWGLFKKIVIADNCAIYANDIFEHYTDYSGGTLFLGAMFFTFQIYGDFSGYSDIAIGTSKLFGVNLLRNFAFPYFSRDIAEFWRRWHISLSSWFRDYVYIPLGGSKGGLIMKIRNTLIIFLLSGFWHGSNWTFIAWGLLNACYFIPLLIANKNRKNLNIAAEGRMLPNVKEIIQIGTTFFLTVIAWIFFRAESLTKALAYIRKMFISLFNKKSIVDVFNYICSEKLFSVLIMITLFMSIEWLQRRKQHALEIGEYNLPFSFHISVYAGLLFAIVWFGGNKQEFIYFQF